MSGGTGSAGGIRARCSPPLSWTCAAGSSNRPGARGLDVETDRNGIIWAWWDSRRRHAAAGAVRWSPAATWIRCPAAVPSTVRWAWPPRSPPSTCSRSAACSRTGRWAVDGLSGGGGFAGSAWRASAPGCWPGPSTRTRRGACATTTAPPSPTPPGPTGWTRRTSGADDEALARIGDFIELHVEQGRGLRDRPARPGRRRRQLHPRPRPLADQRGRPGQPRRHHADGGPCGSDGRRRADHPGRAADRRQTARSPGHRRTDPAGSRRHQRDRLAGGFVAGRAAPGRRRDRAAGRDASHGKAQKIAAFEGCSVSLTEESYSGTVHFDPALQRQLENALPRRPGAGHRSRARRRRAGRAGALGHAVREEPLRHFATRRRSTWRTVGRRRPVPAALADALEALL